jgi:hypothetical protein
MGRQIAEGYQPPTLAALEARVRELEKQVAHLTKVVAQLTGETANQPDPE